MHDDRDAGRGGGGRVAESERLGEEERDGQGWIEGGVAEEGGEGDRVVGVDHWKRRDRQEEGERREMKHERLEGD